MTLQFSCRSAASSYLQRNTNQTHVTYLPGIDGGISEDDLVAIELGASSSDALTDAQRLYAGKVKDKLRQVWDRLLPVLAHGLAWLQIEAM